MKEKKSIFLMICLPIIGLIISFLFVVAVGLTKKINEMLFFPQFTIFAVLFLFVYPYIMVLISNLYFSKAGKKSWDNWLKISSEPRYDYVFAIIAIIPALFLMTELSVFCNINDFSDALISSAVCSFLIWFPLCKRILQKLFGMEFQKGEP